MRARTGTGTGTVALCLALATASPASGSPAAAAPPAAPASPWDVTPPLAPADGTLEVVERTDPDIPLSGLAPGDTIDWAADVTNVSGDGSPLTVRLDAMRSMVLTGDPRSGVQLDVRLCDGGFDPAPAWMSCPGSLDRLGSGPAATLGHVDTTAPLAPGETVGILVRIRFPAEADNAMERASGMLRVSFALADDAGAVPVPGSGAGSPVAPCGGSTTASGHVPRDLLPVTGRDVFAALAGALLALLGGGILFLAARRDRSDGEAAS
ncbi:sortase [Clavibacter californiensis]|uniref:Sortase n=1 Tax=Clavibacter californiensis TaxID=1401995 RepID=A0ABX9N2W9_9MICO|nr:sortase [Clavibacter californiensis]RII88993.1 sortase [Clavibacter californiensis]UKF80556.1 sortase [Clavibacter californiensis]